MVRNKGRGRVLGVRGEVTEKRGSDFEVSGYGFINVVDKTMAELRELTPILKKILLWVSRYEHHLIRRNLS